jgi:hypothetical protein
MEGFYLHRAMRKYGVDNFSINILDTADNINELKEKEMYYISKYDTYRSGYNLTTGGDFTCNDGKVVVRLGTNFTQIDKKRVY